jgi:16S rRNA (cytosine967-C5)-methyltransferase
MAGSPPVPSGGQTAREIAARRLGEQAGLFPELLISPLDTLGLAPRDAALAHIIVDLAIRRWLTLSYLLNRHLRQPVHDLEPLLQGVLLSGAAQLVLLDRIPAHAALNESVDLAKRLVRPGAAGLTNAVLRRVSEVVQSREPRPDDWAERRDMIPLDDGRALVLHEAILPEDPLQRLSVITSHPVGLVRAWAKLYPRATVQSLALHSLASPPVVLNTAHAAGPLPHDLVPHESPGHHIFTGERSELLSLLASRTDLWVQDAASSRAVSAAGRAAPGGAGDPGPRLIVDLCAGQGTKTRQLAAMFPSATVLATDVDPTRYGTLQETFRGIGRVEVVPPQEIAPRAMGRADLVLLDVPCSNTGVLARRPEARYRSGREQLARLSEIQRQILADARPLLRAEPRGRILYSTCSIEREENGFQVDWAKRELGLEVQRHELTFPAGLPGGPAAAYRDGSFFALLG